MPYTLRTGREPQHQPQGQVVGSRGGEDFSFDWTVLADGEEEGTAMFDSSFPEHQMWMPSTPPASSRRDEVEQLTAQNDVETCQQTFGPESPRTRQATLRMMDDHGWR